MPNRRSFIVPPFPGSRSANEAASCHPWALASRDPYPVAEFWRELLGWEITELESYHPGSEECYLISPDGYVVLFYYSPDVKTGKNRAHLDLRPSGGASRDGRGTHPGRHGRPGGQRVLHRQRVGGWISTDV